MFEEERITTMKFLKIPNYNPSKNVYFEKFCGSSIEHEVTNTLTLLIYMINSVSLWRDEIQKSTNGSNLVYRNTYYLMKYWPSIIKI
jgi:hypothetical protein